MVSNPAEDEETKTVNLYFWFRRRRGDIEASRAVRRGGEHLDTIDHFLLTDNGGDASLVQDVYLDGGAKHEITCLLNSSNGRITVSVDGQITLCASAASALVSDRGIIVAWDFVKGWFVSDFDLEGATTADTQVNDRRVPTSTHADMAAMIKQSAESVALNKDECTCGAGDEEGAAHFSWCRRELTG